MFGFSVKSFESRFQLLNLGECGAGAFIFPAHERRARDLSRLAQLVYTDSSLKGAGL